MLYTFLAFSDKLLFRNRSSSASYSNRVCTDYDSLRCGTVRQVTKPTLRLFVEDIIVNVM